MTCRKKVREKNGNCDLGQVLPCGAIWVMGRVSAGDRIPAVLEMYPVHRIEMSEPWDVTWNIF